MNGSAGSVGTSTIKVCVRVRPFNRRELDAEELCCVHMPTQAKTILSPSHIDDDERTFNFDRAYDSSDSSSPNFATQQILMSELGVELEGNALNGFNSCLFAYGQTGSGKTFSVLGGNSSADMRGLLPRIVEDLFATIEREKNSPIEPSTFKCSVSYLEIYNENLNDLLCPRDSSSKKLEVRQSPQAGVFVQNLKEVPVFEQSQVEELMDFGAKARVVAATNMNDTSSRSHCVFTFEIVRSRMREDGTISQLRAKLNLVDLAGSERQKKTGATGQTLKDGSAINKSLTNLALVISKLAVVSRTKRKGFQTGAVFVPFRNSKLTYVLMGSLSGNSKTVMVAALSPAASNHADTLSTLRFAQSVKKVQTIAVKNEESDEAVVEALKAEIAKLKRELQGGGSGEDVADRLVGLQSLTEKYGRDVDAQLDHAKELQEGRRRALQEWGLSASSMAESVGLKKSTPQLLNICDDPSLLGCLVYFLPTGDPIIIGSAASSTIRLAGLGMKLQMASVANADNLNLTIQLVGGRVLVNGAPVAGLRNLAHNDRLIFGFAHCFRLLVPEAVTEADEHKHETDLIAEAIGEIVPAYTEKFDHCTIFVTEMQDRVGKEKGHVFREILRDMSLLVEEANAISHEVRPNERFLFVVEALTNTFTYHTQEPECIVRLIKLETGARRLSNTVRRQKKQCITDVLASASGRKQGGAYTDRHDTIALFDATSFYERIAHMQDVLQDFQRGSTQVADFIAPENDPWRHVPPREVSSILHNRELVLEASFHSEIEELQRVWHSSDYVFDAPSLCEEQDAGLLSEGEAELRSYRESIEEERKTAHARDREQDKRLLDLERELQGLKASQPCIGLVSTTPSERLGSVAEVGVGRDPSGSAASTNLDRMFRIAGEESAQAASMASLLLSRVKAMTRDLADSGRLKVSEDKVAQENHKPG